MFREFTNLLDCNNRKIFVGDSVRMKSGVWKGKTMYFSGKITKNQAGNVIIYGIGNTLNKWYSGDVELIRPKDHNIIIKGD